MLVERSRMSTMSVGLLVMSGSAVSASLTSKESPQSMRDLLSVLLELVIPNEAYSFLSPVWCGAHCHSTHLPCCGVPQGTRNVCL